MQRKAAHQQRGECQGAPACLGSPYAVRAVCGSQPLSARSMAGRGLLPSTSHHGSGEVAEPSVLQSKAAVSLTFLCAFPSWSSCVKLLPSSFSSGSSRPRAGGGHQPPPCLPQLCQALPRTCSPRVFLVRGLGRSPLSVPSAFVVSLTWGEPVGTLWEVWGFYFLNFKVDVNPQRGAAVANLESGKWVGGCLKREQRWSREPV